MIIMQVSYYLVIHICIIRPHDMYTLVQSVWVCKVMWTTSALLCHGSVTLNSKKGTCSSFFTIWRGDPGPHRVDSGVYPL